MEKIKSYTDVEQSRKLADILPLESADGGLYGTNNLLAANNKYWLYTKYTEKSSLPAWSLAALLSVLPNGIIMNKDSQNGKYHFSSTYIGTHITADNPIDACVELILKLYELNLLRL